MVIILKLSIC